MIECEQNVLVLELPFFLELFGYCCYFFFHVSLGYYVYPFPPVLCANVDVYNLLDFSFLHLTFLREHVEDWGIVVLSRHYGRNEPPFPFVIVPYEGGPWPPSCFQYISFSDCLP